MPNNSIENYLGKNMNSLPKELSFKKVSLETDSLEEYRLNVESTPYYFFSKRILRLSINTNKQGTISSVFLVTPKIDISTFQKLIEKYGSPDSMIKMGNVKETHESEYETYKTIRQIGDAVECSFEENPYFINWGKLEYKIRITMDYVRDVSLIKFQKI